MILVQLALCFTKIGLFAIGGAYSFLPLMEKEIVQNRHWLGQDEFLEVTGMSTIFPGAISIKFASYTGYKLAGIPGAIVANLANLLAPALCMIGLSLLYARYAQAPAFQGALLMVRYAVATMIVVIGVKLALGANLGNLPHLLNPTVLILVAAAALLLALTRIHPGFVILAAATYGAILR